MPVSKGRTRGQRTRARARARATQKAQTVAQERSQVTFSQYRRRRILGWTMAGTAVIVGVSHWLAHLGVWAFAKQGVMDVVAGYPMAVLLAIAAAIVLSRDP